MKLFIDGEWDGFRGELMSFALIAEDDRHFYEVLENKSTNQWIRENVIPKLNKEPIHYLIFQAKLEKFLSQFDAIHIIADWPEDIERFCRLLITGPGTRLDTPPLTLEVLRVEPISKNPHNALADAMVLREFCTQNAMLSSKSEVKG